MTSSDKPETPQRPAVPAYGEYAEPDDPRFAPPAVVPPVATSTDGSPRRRRDPLASALLLGLGVFSAFNAIYGAFNLEEVLENSFRAYGGVGDYTPAADLVLARNVIIVSHVMLLAAATLATRSLIRAGRLSFWAPLAAGAVASIIFFGTLMAVVLSDPALLEVAGAMPGA